MLLADAIDQERYHVRLHRSKHGIACQQLVPRFQRQQRFDRSGRAWKKRDDPAGGLLWKKNARLIGTLKLSHCASLMAKPSRRRTVRGTRLIASALLAAEENRAGAAGTEQLAVGDFHEMLVLVGDFRAA